MNWQTNSNSDDPAYTVRTRARTHPDTPETRKTEAIHRAASHCGVAPVIRNEARTKEDDLCVPTRLVGNVAAEINRQIVQFSHASGLGTKITQPSVLRFAFDWFIILLIEW